MPSKRKKQSVQKVYNEEKAKDDIQYMRVIGMSYRDISGHYGMPITYGDIQRIVVHGQFPKGEAKRKQLSLPALAPAPAPAPVCVSCGSVHAGNCNPGRQMVDISAVPLSERRFLLAEAVQRLMKGR